MAPQGWDKGAPYDVIVISGALEVLPEAFLKQVKVGGRIAAIVGQAPVMDCNIITRTGETRLQHRQGVRDQREVPGRRAGAVALPVLTDRRAMQHITAPELAAWLADAVASAAAAARRARKLGIRDLPYRGLDPDPDEPDSDPRRANWMTTSRDRLRVPPRRAQHAGGGLPGAQWIREDDQFDRRHTRLGRAGRSAAMPKY